MTNRVRGGERQERRRAASPSRTLWYSNDLGIHDEPLFLSLIKYRQWKNRVPTDLPLFEEDEKPNLISSNTHDGRQMPIIDLDFPHEYYASHHKPRGLIFFRGMSLEKRYDLQEAFNRLGLSRANLGGDLVIDVPHHYEKSSTEGHGHLYIDFPISNWKFFRLMTSLYRAGAIELGYYIWSLRRGGNFARLPGTKKTDDEQGYYTYGWFKKLKVEE